MEKGERKGKWISLFLIFSEVYKSAIPNSQHLVVVALVVFEYFASVLDDISDVVDAFCGVVVVVAVFSTSELLSLSLFVVLIDVVVVSALLVSACELFPQAVINSIVNASNALIIFFVIVFHPPVLYV